jgi:zinc protease
VTELGPLVDAIVKDIQEKGVTQAEVDRAKRNLVAGRLRNVERLAGFGGKADILNFYEMWTGDPGYLAKDLARYRAVTPADVKAAAQKYLTGNRLVLDVEPAGQAAAATNAGKATP